MSFMPCSSPCGRTGNRMNAFQEQLKKDVAFSIEVEDGWPPFSIENLPCTILNKGIQIDAPPLFIKNLSVGDVICTEDALGVVKSWSYIEQSKRTTVWIGVTDYELDLDVCLDKLMQLSCNIIKMKNYGCYSVDVPETCDINKVDEVLAQFKNDNLFVAFPSFRHMDFD